MAFKLSDDFISKYSTKASPFGFNGLGELVYMRTYSRLKENGLNEKWFETIQRVVEGTYTLQKKQIESLCLGWNESQAQASAQEMYDRMFQMKFLPPGRGLWAMGTDIVNKKGLAASLNNCGFVSTKDMGKSEPFSKPFCFTMDMSMLGVGIGFDTVGEGNFVVGRPDIDEQLVIVEDTREGWVDSLKILLDSFNCGYNPLFDYSRIRAPGIPLKTFGGLSSGPQPLIDLHQNVRAVLNKNIGNPISVTSIVDIMNLIGKCVVSGNVRRCLPKGTLVHTQDGLVPIEKVEPGTMVHTSNGLHSVSELVYQGEQEVITIVTELGEFECTEKHKVAVVSGINSYTWKMANELVENDMLVFPEHIVQGVKTNLPPWEYNKPKHSTTCKDIVIPELDEGIAWLIGYLHGNGCVYPNFDNNGFNAYVSFACDPKRENIIEKVISQVERFGINPLANLRTNGAFMVNCQSKQLSWYFSKFKTSKKSIVVPSFILEGLPEIRSSYVAGLFDADGSCLTRPLNLCTSIYPEFLKQVQSIYASLGMASRFKTHREAKGEWKELYQLNLVGEFPINNFNKNVSKYSLKYIKKDLEKSQNDYGYPSELVKLSGLRYGSSWSPNNKQMTIGTLSRCGTDINFYPIKFVELKRTGKVCETYDISVPSAKEFIAAEGLLVHNTALISFGASDSTEFMDLKDYSKNPHRMDYGWTSNNSIFADLGMNYSQVAERICINGEPGLAWLDNMRNYSRMCDLPDGKDHRVMGGNPCLEQSLEHSELCCLVENFLNRADSLEDFLRTLKFSYLYSKTVTLANTHCSDTNRVQLRNRRIGCSVSGIAQFLSKYDLHTLNKWLDAGYKVVGEWDTIYSEWFCIPRSIKMTSVKPSGTVSLLAGATPGMHYPESRFYIRRMRLSNLSPLVKPLQEANYFMEPCVGSENDTIVVEIPIDVGEGIRTINQVSMWEQLSLAANMQRWWADNQVSCTITFNPKTEGCQIANALDYFQYHLKGISFLPKCDYGAFPQMPYEEITEQVYLDRCKDLKPLQINSMSEESVGEKFCDGESCLRN